MKRLFLLIYYIVASKLPDYAFPGGKFFNAFRIWLVKRIIPVGNNCRIQRHVYLGDGNNISIGNHCRINDHVKLDNVCIGNYVMIARNTQILGKMHNFDDLNTPMVFQKGLPQQQSVIEDDVWIGLNVIVMPGINIKKGSIVAAGAVLTKDTESYGIYGGVPAKLIRYRK